MPGNPYPTILEKQMRQPKSGRREINTPARGRAARAEHRAGLVLLLLPPAAAAFAQGCSCAGFGLCPVVHADSVDVIPRSSVCDGAMAPGGLSGQGRFSFPSALP